MKHPYLRTKVSTSYISEIPFLNFFIFCMTSFLFNDRFNPPGHGYQSCTDLWRDVLPLFTDDSCQLLLALFLYDFCSMFGIIIMLENSSPVKLLETCSDLVIHYLGIQHTTHSPLHLCTHAVSFQHTPTSMFSSLCSHCALVLGPHQTSW